MNFICNIFTPLLFYLTPPKVLFCFFPYLLPSPVCTLYIFLCALTPCFPHSPMSCTSPFSQLSICLFAGSLHQQTPSLWELLIHYSIHCSSINSAIVLLLSVPPSIYIPHNQCPIHPISTFFWHMFIPFFQLSSHSLTHPTHILSVLNLSLSS